VFGRSIGFQFVDYDDFALIAGCQQIRTGLRWSNILWAFTNVDQSNWYPLTLLVQQTLCTIFGLKPGPFHFTNVVFHSANICLLFVFLKSTTRSRVAAIFAAVLWGIHPLRVESVAWASEMKDCLCGFFWMLCMLAYARFVGAPTIRRYVAVCIMLLLALMSKPMAVTLPFVLLLLDFWPLKNARQEAMRNAGFIANRWLNKLPLILLTIGACAVAYFAQLRTGAMKGIDLIPMVSRLENAPIAAMTYLVQTFFPVHLGVFYPHPAVLGMTLLTWKWVSSILVLTAVTCVSFWLRQRRAYLLVGWLWFLGVLLPVIGIVQVGLQAHADRYTYLPSIGLTIALVWLCSDTGSQLKLVIGIALGLVLTVASYFQTGYWRDSQTLFTRSNGVIPKNYMAKGLLAEYAVKDGDTNRAFQLASESLQIAPNMPEGHFAMGKTLKEKGDLKGAFEHIRRAVQISSQRANYRNEFAALLVEMNRNAEAEAQFQIVLKSNPYSAEALHSLAVLQAARGDLDDAIHNFERVLLIYPEAGGTHGLLAEAMRLNGDRAGAIAHYRAAILSGHAQPEWKLNYAWLVATNPQSSPDDRQRAIDVAQNATADEEKHSALAWDALAAALARSSRFDDAAAAAQTALTIAKENHQSALAAAIQRRRILYQNGQPYTAQLVKSPQAGAATSSPSTMPLSPVVQ